MSDKFSKQFRWIHVSFSPPSEMNTDPFEKVFNKAKDWFRYSNNCWFVYTALDSEVWRDRVRKLPGMGDQDIFLYEVDPVLGDGYLTEWMWTKLHSKTEATSKD